MVADGRSADRSAGAWAELCRPDDAGGGAAEHRLRGVVPCRPTFAHQSAVQVMAYSDNTSYFKSAGWFAGKIHSVGNLGEDKLWVNVEYDDAPPGSEPEMRHAIRHKLVYKRAVVWAKLKGFPPWPARAYTRCVMEAGEPTKDLVYFLGDNTHQWMTQSALVQFDAESWPKMSASHKRKDRSLRRGIVTAIKEVQEAREDLHQGMRDYMDRHAAQVELELQHAERKAQMQQEAAERAVAAAAYTGGEGVVPPEARMKPSAWGGALKPYNGQEVQCRETIGVLVVEDDDARVRVTVDGESRATDHTCTE